MLPLRRNYRYYFKYSIFVKTCSLAMFSVISFGIYYLLSEQSLLYRSIGVLLIFLLFSSIAIAPIYFEEWNDRYVLRLALMKRVYDKSVYTATLFDSDQLTNSIRVFASGGFFGFTGIFWNNKLGFFQCYISNLKSHFVHIRKRNKEKGGILINIDV